MAHLDRLRDKEGEWEETKKIRLFASVVWCEVYFGCQDLQIEEIHGEKKGFFSLSH